MATLKGDIVVDEAIPKNNAVVLYNIRTLSLNHTATTLPTHVAVRLVFRHHVHCNNQPHHHRHCIVVVVVVPASEVTDTICEAVSTAMEFWVN